MRLRKVDLVDKCVGSKQAPLCYVRVIGAGTLNKLYIAMY